MFDLESKFSSWAKGPSVTENSKIENAERAIRRAISASESLMNRDYTIFIQGSYRNRVNVKQNSDVDIGIVCHDSYYYEGLSTEGQKSLSPLIYTYFDYKKDIKNAIISTFGSDSVRMGTKALNIKENTYRIEADVAYFFEYRKYSNNWNYEKGVVMFDQSGHQVINWPEQHYENAVLKNSNTSKRFKKCVRILKRLKVEMESNGYLSKSLIPGFLIECLVYNVPNDKFTSSNLVNCIRENMLHIYENTQFDRNCNNWTEVSELKHLFSAEQKWNRDQVNDFIIKAWNYLGFNK